jgi:eukaryotic-like serine/threonine-protein kinase
MLTFLFSSGSMLSQATNSNLVMYDNPNFGIKIRYPVDWTKEETDDEFGKGVIFPVPGSPIKYAEKLSIDILENNDAKSLADKVNDLIDFNQHKNDALTNYQVIESTPIVVNNIPAYKIVDTYTDPDKFGNVKSMSIEVLKGNKQYDMLFTSEPEKFDNLLPTIQKMIDSFQITS